MKTRHPNPIQAKPSAKRDLGYGNQIPAGTTKQQPITHHKPDVNIFPVSNKKIRRRCNKTPRHTSLIQMDTETFKTIFMPLRHKLYGMALRMTGNSDDDADAVQEAYARFWEQRDAIAAKESPEAFCTTIQRNICIDILRRRHPAEPVENAGGVSEPVDADESIERAARIIRIIDTLPEKQRRIIRMRDLQELQFHEISKLTGESECNIRVLLSRARKKVRELFLKQK